MPITLAEIRNSINENIGRKVIVTAQLSRKKKKERVGILLQSYPSVFTVELENVRDQFDCVSYSYTDILTDSISIQYIGDEDDEDAEVL